MKKIKTILTCHNRCEKTIRCIQSLIEGNPDSFFEFIIVDDASSDDTVEKLEKMTKSQRCDIVILHGDGNLYWSGGMRNGMLYAQKKADAQYILLVNDDVSFLPGVIDKMVKECKNEVLVGAMCDEKGDFSYGGIRYKKGIRYDMIGPEQENLFCDTFNANCVLLPNNIFMSNDVIDSKYRHSLGDFDYGLLLSRNHVKIRVVNYYVGICPDNDNKGTWQDKSLGRIKRIQLKERIKGAPCNQWFYFLKKNFGIVPAIVHSVSPYIRIIMGR